jgi:hypothetical protein
MKLKTVRDGKGRMASKIKQAFSNIGDAIKKLQSGDKAKSPKDKANYIGMAINYIAMDLKAMGLKREASAIMKVGAALAEGNFSTKLSEGDVEGQTPQQEQQLKGLGWTDKDIDTMSARQIDIILKRKTRRRMKANSVEAANTPAQTKEMLEKKQKGAKELYDALKKFDYGTYNISDFYKSDLAKLRKISDAITKHKSVLEATLYRFNRQSNDDLKALAKKAKEGNFITVEGATGKVEGAHHADGKDWYVDTEFINHSQRVYPGATLRHMGMGEFVLETPDGDIEFDRMRGKKFEGQSGRSHKLYGDKKAVAKLVKLMESKGKSKAI